MYSTTNFVTEEGFFRSFEFAGDANFIATFDVGSPSVSCDFGGDGICDVTDLDALLYEGIVNANTVFDVDRNGTVDLGDRDQWLADAGTKENDGVFFVLGDADLDGDVEASDLNVLGVHWQQTGVRSWSMGDSNGDRRVDATDLNAVGLNWLSGTPAARAVAEPSGFSVVLVTVLGLVTTRRRIAWRHCDSVGDDTRS